MKLSSKLSTGSILALSSALFACGGHDDGVAGKLKIASLKSAGTSLMSAGYRPMTDASTDLQASSGHYSFAKIDGIKVTVAEIRGADAHSDNPLVTQTINQEIELTSDPNALIALDKDVTWAVGDYSGIDLRLENKWSFKGYCKTQLSGGQVKLVYTTASGVKVSTGTCAESSCTLPSDYAYYDISWLDDYYTQHSDSKPNIATHYKFSVAKGDTPSVSLLFDATNTVSCWDGQSWDKNLALGPFQVDDSRRTTLFPDGTGAFAVPVLPVLAYVGKTSDTTAPSARTFLVAASSSTLATPIDFKNTQTVTFLYDSNGTAIAGNARNLSGNDSSNPIDADFDGFATSSTGTGIDFYPSGWYWAGGSATPELIHNRKFEGFTLPATRYSTFSVVLKDGDGCGKSLTDFQGYHPSKDCLNTTSSYYWREAVR